MIPRSYSPAFEYFSFRCAARAKIVIAAPLLCGLAVPDFDDKTLNER